MNLASINPAAIWEKIQALWNGAVASGEAYLEGLLNFDITPEFLLLTDLCLVFVIFFVWLIVVTWKKFF